MRSVNNNQLHITVLGSGTSSGVPTIGCACPTCTSNDPHDQRLRPSIHIRNSTYSVVVDTSSDFRQQCLGWGIDTLDAVVYTHHHFDHIAGFDDLRAFNYWKKAPMPVYAMEETLSEIRQMFHYAFGDKSMNESSSPAARQVTIGDEPFMVGDIEFIPIPLRHGRMRVNGYRIGDFAYCTDCNYISDEGYQRLEGVRVLLLDALRHRKHPTHFTVAEAVAAAVRIGAEETYFTHISHDIMHAEVDAALPNGIGLAYDGLKIVMNETQ